MKTCVLKNQSNFILASILCNFVWLLFAEVPHFISKKSLDGKELPKILLLWSKGGGCHISMRDALNAYYKDYYNIEALNPISDLLHFLDPLRMITFDRINGEDFYNMLMARGKYRTVNQLVNFGRYALVEKRDRIEAALKKYFSQEKPDVVISLIPLFNSAFAVACAETGIPFILLCPDALIPGNMARNYFLYYTPIATSGKQKYACTLPFDVHMTAEQKEQGLDWIDEKTIQLIGFPLRPSFFEQNDVEKIRHDFNLPDNKPIIMMVAGGAGSAGQLRYVHTLAKLEVPCHLLICIGRNESIRRKLEAIMLPNHITRTIVGYTQQIGDLMGVSDVLLTKSGPSTIFEAIEKRLPFVIDAKVILDIEQGMMETIQKNKLGRVITHKHHLLPAIRELLVNREERMRMRECMQKTSNIDFAKKFKILIDSLL